jgi:hypothetical protein
MAEPTPTTPNGETVHPDVGYERSDVSPRDVVVFVAILTGVLLVCAVFLHALFFYFMRVEQKAKETDLPPVAQGEDDRWPPAPRLEGIEDVGAGKFTFYPPRGEEYLKKGKDELDEGGGKDIPLDKAIDALANHLPVLPRPKESERADAPLGSLPSKASAGRTNTGGQ